MTESKFYNPFEQMNLDPGACFLCGGVPEEATREHVFPMWLLQREGLLNRSLTLLNGTLIPYRQLTVPCCPECNNEHLSRIEDAIGSASAQGAQAVRELPEEMLFQWMAKIFIGILWAELRLKADRAQIDGGPIVPPEVVADYSVLHGHLQSVRRPFVFQDPKPWSILVTDMHSCDLDVDFDYHDDVMRLLFGIRFSGVGLIACLQDNSTQRQLYADVWDELTGIPLHPIQWDELWAKVLYRQVLLRRTPKYMNVFPPNDNQPVHVMSLPMAGFAPETMWDEWDQETYAHILLMFLRHKVPDLSIEEIFKPPDMVNSWVYREDGTVNRVDADGNRLP